MKAIHVLFPIALLGLVSVVGCADTESEHYKNFKAGIRSGTDITLHTPTKTLECVTAKYENRTLSCNWEKYNSEQ
jgi:hypothetical protein